MQFEHLGPYRLGKKLGQGGMGAVYAGFDAATGTTAAIKVLAPAMAAEEGFRVRFEAEIDSLKKLRHPNIVRLFGYGEEQGTLFYAMELIDGTSLEEELRAGRRFEWREVTDLSIKLCKALKHAHDHGVIHRDIKPANLLLPPDGQIKLSDFGIARLFGNTRMTSDGGILGTAEYMAPEQADGRSVTDRCDQYSLGGVMFALLAGRAPFRAGTLVEMLQLQRFAEPPSVRAFAPEVPVELDRIIHQLLEKDPHKRFANTLLIARALEAMQRGLSLPTYRDDFLVHEPDADAPHATNFDPFAATLVPGELPAGEPQLGAVDELHDTLGPADEISLAPVEHKTQLPERREGQPTRFTAVRERDDGDSIESAPWRSLLSGPTLALIAGLLITGLLGWYALQPATADQLVRKIDRAAQSEKVETLLEVEAEIHEFLTYHADDPRSAGIREYQKEVDLFRRDRQFRRQFRRGDKGQALTAVERAYAEAMQLADLNPGLAITKLQAILDVYDDPLDESRSTRDCVTLTQARLKELRAQQEQHSSVDLETIAAQLSRAAALRESDLAAARQIWLGVVSLYGDKSWAAEPVAAARAALEETAGDPKTPSDATAETNR